MLYNRGWGYHVIVNALRLCAHSEVVFHSHRPSARPSAVSRRTISCLVRTYTYRRAQR